ncbi:MAG: hypothetical protein IT316_14935 [Anaerolineales bacterium]|nr:hypothetical protein [Anaerolineales bacterium]
MSGAYTELVELDTARKWEYLRRYYAEASRFYGLSPEAVTDERVASALAGIKNKPAPVVRKEIRLKDWLFKLDVDGSGLRAGYFSAGHDESGWEEITAPHMARYIPPNPVRFGESIHDIFESGEGGTIWRGDYAAWYRCKAAVNDLQADQVAYLSFSSVNLESTVWVDENPVMLDHLGLFPFEMEITEELRAAKDRDVQIAVQAKTVATNKPWMFGQGFASAYYAPPYASGKLGEDWVDEAWAGLAGEGKLLLVKQTHLGSAYLRTQVLKNDVALIGCRVDLRNMSWERFGGKVRVEISPWLPVEGGVMKVIEQEVEALPMNHATAELSFTLENPLVWEPGQARLYLAHVVLLDEDGQPLDDLYETFGVRTVEMIGGHFYVNGKLTVLRGSHELTYHPGESPVCPSDEWIVREVLLHQELGTNCSRYPSDERVHHRRIAEICDQLGYMLAWAGYFAVWIIHPELELHARRDVPALVRDLRNHPSIIIWEMGDEPLMVVHNYRRYRWYEQVYRLVEQEDDSRPIQPAGHFAAEIWEMMQAAHTEEERAERRAQILRDFPLYSLPRLYWDLHTSPMILPLRPVRAAVEEAARAFGGARLTTYAEFGFDALPSPERQLALHGRTRWGANPFWNRDRAEDDLIWYGRKITPDDWRETQAAQALVLSTTIDCLRELPQIFGGFFFMMMVDVQTFLQGLLDAGAVPKLGYFVLQKVLHPVFTSGLHGNTVVKRGDPLRITVSVWGEAIQKATLRGSVRINGGPPLREYQVDKLALPGGAAYAQIAEWSTAGLPEGLLSLEMILYDEDESEINRTLELFYLTAEEAPENGR